MARKRAVTIAVFGAGAGGRGALQRLKGRGLRHIHVAHVLDNDRRRWGTFLGDVPIVRPSRKHVAAVDYVLVASIHADDIRAQIEQLGGGRKVVHSPLALRDVEAPALPLTGRAVTRATAAELRAWAARAIALPRAAGPATATRVACTIASNNYLAHATVLARSFLAQHPEAHFVLCLADERDASLAYPDALDARIRVVPARALGIAGFASMAFQYTVVEFNTAVKPFLLEHLLWRLGYASALYLDPDILVTGSLAPLYDALGTRDVVLTPHITTPYVDERHPGVTDLLRAGVYNLGFIGVAARPAVRTFLRWWQARLERDCIVAPADGIFVDQRWVDMLPAFHDRVHVERDPGCNVAYWNLHERQVRRRGEAFTCNGQALRFFHFSGAMFEAHGTTLSKHQDRHRLPAAGALTDLFHAYRYLLFRSGHATTVRTAYAYGHFADGMAIPPQVRSIYRQHRDTIPGDPFRVGRRTFRAWLAEPDPEHQALTRLEAETWRQRADLRAQVPDLRLAAPSQYRAFLREHARALGLSASILSAPADAGAGAPARSDAPRAGINVAGYLDTESGVGELGRSLVRALRAGNRPHALVNVPQPWLRRRQHDMVERGRRRGATPHPVSVLAVNADAVEAVAPTLGPAFFQGRHVIGYWVWELETFPERWTRAFDRLDEIWVPSRFCLDAISRSSPVPVVYVPPAIDVATPRPMARRGLGVRADATLFSFVFDVNSFLPRKNPLAVVDAFERAFGTAERARGEVALVLKSTAPVRPSPDLDRLRARCASAGVRLVEGYWPHARVLQLIAASQAYVSLHRAEGFGYTVAEAQAIGVPVIATAYSATTDLVDVSHALPVRWLDVELTASIGPYDRGARWADPDVDHAAAQMRLVHEDRATAAALGARARDFMAARFSPSAVAAIVDLRLRPLDIRLGG